MSAGAPWHLPAPDELAPWKRQRQREAAPWHLDPPPAVPEPPRGRFAPCTGSRTCTRMTGHWSGMCPEHFTLDDSYRGLRYDEPPPHRCVGDRARGSRTYLLPGGGTITERYGPRPVVHIAPSARDTIATILQSDGGHLETGGVLVGDAVAAFAGDRSSITRASGPGPSFRRRRDEIRFDYQDLQDEANPDLAIGFWHSHPASTRAGLSDADLACYRRLVDRSIRPIGQFIAIVAVEHPTRRWAEPQLAAWLIRKDEFERAALQVGTPPARDAARSTRAWMPRGKGRLGLYQLERLVGEWLRGGVSEADVNKRIDQLQAAGRIVDGALDLARSLPSTRAAGWSRR